MVSTPRHQQPTGQKAHETTQSTFRGATALPPGKTAVLVPGVPGAVSLPLNSPRYSVHLQKSIC
jgi:hypothetical protein